MPVYHIVLTAAALQKFWNQVSVESPDLVPLFQNRLGFLHFQIRISLLISPKMLIVGILIENALMYKSINNTEIPNLLVLNLNGFVPQGTSDDV